MNMNKDKYPFCNTVWKGIKCSNISCGAYDVDETNYEIPKKKRSDLK